MSSWPVPRGECPGTRVGAVTVNWNTRDLLARLVFGLRRVVEPGIVAEIVVVDNGSTDGSRELALALAEASVVRVILNEGQRYHGPGLTQGVNLLADIACRGRPVDLVWAIDTDVLLLRADVIRAASEAMRRLHCVFAADPDDYAPAPPHVTTAPLSMCSTLFDPAIVWQPRHRPFLLDGEPAREMQADLVAARHNLLAFPFCADEYLLHLGRSTLATVVARNDRANLHFDWAVGHREPHFGLRPNGPLLRAQFEARFREAVADDETETIVSALAS